MPGFQVPTEKEFTSWTCADAPRRSKYLFGVNSLNSASPRTTGAIAGLRQCHIDVSNL
jgi:hypothetical protein